MDKRSFVRDKWKNEVATTFETDDNLELEMFSSLSVSYEFKKHHNLHCHQLKWSITIIFGNSLYTHVDVFQFLLGTVETAQKITSGRIKSDTIN